MEAPPLKPLLVIVTLLGVFAVLIGTIPSGFLVSTEDRRNPNVPENFDALELQQYVNTYNFTNTYPTCFFKKDFGGHSLYWASDFRYGDFWCSLTHYDWEFPILGVLIGAHQLDWYGHVTFLDYGDSIHGEEITENWNSETKLSHFTVSCKHFSMYVWFTYNTNAYSSVLEAYQDDGLLVLWAIEWDEMGTGLNAWNLIAMLLFWQLPDVHIALNIILSLPFWVAIGWACFAFIMAVIKSLPFT